MTIIKKLFVKFVPWNDNTFRSLQNKTIKFSTAYELNDYNEFSYSGLSRDCLDIYERNRGEIKSAVLKIFGEHKKRFALIENLKMSPYTIESSQRLNNYLKNFDTFLKRLDTPFINEDLTDWLTLLIENIAYSSVGIFSCADVKIFETEWAQLLYAYYADSLKGVVLLYEQENTKSNLIKSVDYEKELICIQEGIAALQWAKGDFSNTQPFNRKHEIWEHEDELRLIDSPGIKAAADYNIELKAIFYTGRSQDDLCKIKNAISDYDNPVELKEIYAGHGKTSHLFKMASNDIEVYKWIQRNFKPAT